MRELADVLEHERHLIGDKMWSKDEAVLFQIVNQFEIRHRNASQQKALPADEPDRGADLSDDTIAALLTVTVPDLNGERPSLYVRDEVMAAIKGPKPVKPLVDELVSDLIVSAGGRKAAAMRLAETSGQPVSAISLVEAKLKRQGQSAVAAAAPRGVEPGLALIDEWVGRVGLADDAQVLAPEPTSLHGPSVA